MTKIPLASRFARGGGLTKISQPLVSLEVVDLPKSLEPLASLELVDLPKSLEPLASLELVD